MAPFEWRRVLFIFWVTHSHSWEKFRHLIGWISKLREKSFFIIIIITKMDKFGLSFRRLSNKIIYYQFPYNFRSKSTASETDSNLYMEPVYPNKISRTFRFWLNKFHSSRSKILHVTQSWWFLYSHYLIIITIYLCVI